jgi:hypothetical protein
VQGAGCSEGAECQSDLGAAKNEEHKENKADIANQVTKVMSA